MPRYTSSQTFTEGNTQIVALPEDANKDNEKGKLAPEDEDLEVKLARITELVPLRINNTSGSSAGSGSGDFHQYRSMRRHEQDRLIRMEIDYKKRKAESEFEKRRAEMLKEAEERTAKRRNKRLKKKEKKKAKITVTGSLASIEEQREDGDEDEEDEQQAPQEALD
eukprot:jgi/Mesen1/8259/ME000445S07408